MFCKYCGKPTMEALCDACGSSVVLRERSKELVKLMAQSQQGNAVTETPSLQEAIARGYENGLQDGLRKGQETEKALWIQKMKMGIIAALAACFLLSCICAVAGYHIGFRNGEAIKDDVYASGDDAGGSDGVVSVTSTPIDVESPIPDPTPVSTDADGGSLVTPTPFVSESPTPEPTPASTDEGSGATVTPTPSVSAIPALELTPTFTDETDGTIVTPTPSDSATPTPEPSSSPTLFVESDDEIVARNKRIQRRLKELGLYTGDIDGIIGPKTIGAIRRFQEKNGLKVDGVVGEETWALLFPNAVTPTP